MPVPQRVYAYVVAWLLCLNLRLVLAGLERTCSYNMRHQPGRGRLCGKVLASVVSNVCRLQGGFYGGGQDTPKRSIPAEVPDDIDVGVLDGTMGTDDVTEPDDVTGPFFLSKGKATSLLERKRRGQQGIVCECCYHRCTFRELTQYCVGTGKKRRSSGSEAMAPKFPRVRKPNGDQKLKNAPGVEKKPRTAEKSMIVEGISKN